MWSPPWKGLRDEKYYRLLAKPVTKNRIFFILSSGSGILYSAPEGRQYKLLSDRLFQSGLLQREDELFYFLGAVLAAD